MSEELLDTVAKAIHKADITESPWLIWDQLLPEGRDDYRRMAQAAINALQLTEEKRITAAPLPGEKLPVKRLHRLVSPWAQQL